MLAVVVSMGLGQTALARNSYTSQKCARPAEETSLEVAAVQQQLMVAALTCNDVPSFNAFQNGYLSDLRSSDRQLMLFFHRLYGGRGESHYHAFKTRLANDDSMRSIQNNVGYCKAANAAFAAMKSPVRPSLSAFVEAIPVGDVGPVESCAALSAEREPIPAIVPLPNPMRLAALQGAHPDPSPQAAAKIEAQRR